MAESLSRRALLTGRFLSSRSADDRTSSKGGVQAGSERPPLSEVQVYGSERSPASLTVETYPEESPPPWSRHER